MLVRSAALCTMGHLEPSGLAKHVDLIVPMLKDEDSDVRSAAKDILGYLEPSSPHAIIHGAPYCRHHPCADHKLITSGGAPAVCTGIVHDGY